MRWHDVFARMLERGADSGLGEPVPAPAPQAPIDRSPVPRRVVGRDSRDVPTPENIFERLAGPLPPERLSHLSACARVEANRREMLEGESAATARDGIHYF
jgi:hypothetical protein